MNLKQHNRVTAIAVISALLCFFLGRAAVPGGRLLLALCCIVFVVNLIASGRKGLRCPRCGGTLAPMGRRHGGGVFREPTLDQISCPHCGAVLSSRDLPID